MKIIVGVLSFLLACTALAAQGTKRPLDHSVYALWKSIKGEKLSPDGRWAAYTIEPGEGDPALIISNLLTGKQDTLTRGTDCAFSDDSQFTAFMVKPAYAVTKKARIDKKKPDEMPKDTLVILRLGSMDTVRIPRVKSFAFPEDGAGWIAYQLEKSVAAKPDSARAGTKNSPHSPDATENEGGKGKEAGTTVVLRSLETGNEWRFAYADEYAFSKNGARLLVSSTGGDSTSVAGVFTFATGPQQRDTLAIGKGTYKQIALDEEGTQAAFLADRDTAKSKQRYFALYHWIPGMDSAARVADTLTAGMKKGWTISQHGNLWFSGTGKRLFFGTAPVPMPDDTTFNEEETAAVDIWHWQDIDMQPEQIKNLEREINRNYLAVWHTGNKRLVQLGDVDMPEVSVVDKGDARVALGSSDIPYRRSRMWLGTTYTDVFVVDVTTGVRIKLLERIRNGATLSPGGSYASYYDYRKRHWYATNVATLRTTQLTKGITTPLYDELEDHPDDPGPHGQAGWTEGDMSFLVYDRFDLWATDPTGKTPPVNLTAGSGRKNSIRYRYQRLDPEERFLKAGASLFLRAFRETDKYSGYAVGNSTVAASPRQLVLGPYEYGVPRKAKNDSSLMFTRSTFEEFPDLYVSDFSVQTPRKISEANPQQREYLWGSAELISWVPPDGKRLEGLLFKPAEFDPKKKYPMIVYFYERHADGLHRYLAPGPSRSTVNPSFYTSRGYVFFIPDIRYRTGHPGKSALDAVVSGTKNVIARGFVDKERVGIQGQSWGGYQVAYIVTQTPMFRAAGAGAPVSNMTSAYGGVRWESGWSRAWQYEKAQSRIGAPLWNALDLYIENSPLFFANRVTTPLLIMHNDADGAVPWYQGIEFYSALRRLEKPVWMLTYNDEQHNLTKWKNRKDLSIRLAQFFDHYLKGEPMPVWMAKGRSATLKKKTMAIEPAGSR